MFFFKWSAYSLELHIKIPEILIYFRNIIGADLPNFSSFI